MKGRLSIRRPDTTAIETIHKRANQIIFTLLEQSENLVRSLFQGSPNFFFNGPDDNVDLWSRARFERNIIEQLSNFTDLNIERI